VARGVTCGDAGRECFRIVCVPEAAVSLGDSLFARVQADSMRWIPAWGTGTFARWQVGVGGEMTAISGGSAGMVSLGAGGASSGVTGSYSRGE
jgi:hypothetical protein